MTLQGEGVELIRVEALPVRTVRRNNDRGRTIAEALDDLQRSRVNRDIPHLMRDTELLEMLDREFARKASRGAKNSDQ